MRIQRSDRSTYIESDEAEVSRMVRAGIVEGVGPRSGRIDILRIVCTEDEARARVAVIRSMEPHEAKQPRFSINSQASREIFREQLSDGFWTWCHKANRGLSLAA